MTTTDCPQEGIGSDNGCDGQAHLLFDGSLYCPKCEGHFITNHELRDQDLEEYGTEVRELIDSNFDDLYTEYVRLLDMYCKEPAGFPNKEAYQKFQAVFPLFMVKFIRELNETREKEHEQLKRELRKASRNKRMKP